MLLAPSIDIEMIFEINKNILIVQNIDIAL